MSGQKFSNGSILPDYSFGAAIFPVFCPDILSSPPICPGWVNMNSKFALSDYRPPITT